MERFEARDDATELRLRHADWLVFLAEEAEPELKRAAQREWLDRLQAEQDNIRVALAWLEGVGDAERGLRLAAALWRFWRMRNHLVEGSQALETVLRLGRAGPATLQARALIGASRLAMDRGNVERSLARAEEALAAAGVSGAARDIAAGRRTSA
jgi:non-specific serine/threonine protein kinase